MIDHPVEKPPGLFQILGFFSAGDVIICPPGCRLPRVAGDASTPAMARK